MLYQNKTFMAKKEESPLTWIVLDASGKTLGRLASEIAKILRGKHKPTYTPNVSCGDGVIVINAEKIAVTGHKDAQKQYWDYTGWVGGNNSTLLGDMRKRHPDRIITRAVKGMVPRTSLGRAQMKRLRVFAGDKHHMDAQKPLVVNI